MNQQDALKNILKKSASDSAFRAQLLKDPAAALQAAGLDLSAAKALKFIDPSAETVIALPPFGGEEEISDEALASAAGGAMMTASHSLCTGMCAKC